MTLEMEQSPERQYRRVRLAESVQPIVKMDDRPIGQPALYDVQPDMMHTIRKDSMVVARGIGDDSEPADHALQVETVRIAPIGRHRSDLQRPRIKIGMPQEPRRGCRPGRVFSESAIPIGPDRRSGRR